MNEEDIECEKDNLDISPFSMNLIFEEQNLNLPELDDAYPQPKYSTAEQKIQLSHGAASCCIDSIVSHHNLQEACDRIKK